MAVTIDDICEDPRVQAKAGLNLPALKIILQDGDALLNQMITDDLIPSEDQQEVLDVITVHNELIAKIDASDPITGWSY